jgi:hypothetical protein
MSYTGLRFNANLNADKIFIDYSNLPDTINHAFFITIQNQSVSSLYFKITSFISNWTVTSPSNGQLGGIGGGGSSTFTITISRNKPSGETIDTGYLRVEAYTDSNYTNQVGYADLNVTIYIEDLENWTDVTINSFDDGTQQGWSLSSGISVTNERSIETGGYSLKSSVSNASVTFAIEKTITLPNRNKVRINFYKSCYMLGNYPTVQGASFGNISVKVNNNPVFQIPFNVVGVSLAGGGTYSGGWWKFCADLSAYKGQTVTIRIEWVAYAGTSTYTNTYIDRIIIAGKD